MAQITKEPALVFTAEESGQVAIKFSNSDSVIQSIRKNDELVTDKQTEGDRVKYITVEQGDKIYLWAETDGSDYEILR